MESSLNILVLFLFLHPIVSSEEIFADDLTAVESRYKVDAKPSPYVPPQPAPDFDYFAPTLTPTLEPVSSPSPSSPVTPYFTPTTIPTESTSTTTFSTSPPSTTSSPSFRKLIFPKSFKPTFLDARIKTKYTTATTQASTTRSTTTTTTTPKPAPPSIQASLNPLFNEVQSTREPTSVNTKASTSSYTRPFYSKKKFNRKKASSVYYKVKKNPSKLRKIKKVLRPVSYSTSPEKYVVDKKAVRELPSTPLASTVPAVTSTPASVYTSVTVPKKSIRSLISRKSTRPVYRYSPTTPSSLYSQTSEPRQVQRYRSKSLSRSKSFRPSPASTTLAATTALLNFSASTTREAVSPSVSQSLSPSFAFPSTTAFPFFASTTANEISYTPEPKRIRSLPLTQEQAHLYSSIPYSSTTTLPTTKSLPTRAYRAPEQQSYVEALPKKQGPRIIDIPSPHQRIKQHSIRRTPLHYRNAQALNEVRREEKYPAQPYSFSYDVKDEYSGTDFYRSEESSGPVTKGSYKVALPDGRIQIVRYVADENGYKATVSYEGEAVFPSPQLYEQEPLPKRNFRHSRKVDLSSYSGDNGYSFLRDRRGATSRVQETTLRPVSLPLRHRLSRGGEGRSAHLVTTAVPPSHSQSTPHSINFSSPAPNPSNSPLRPALPSHDPNYDGAQRNFGIKVDY